MAAAAELSYQLLFYVKLIYSSLLLYSCNELNHRTLTKKAASSTQAFCSVDPVL